MAIAVPVIDGRKVLKGIGFMVLAATLFPFLNATSKYLSADYAILQIVWARYLGHLVFVLAVFWPRHGPMLLRPKQPLVQLLRSMLLLSSSGIYFFALSYVPLATAAAISFTGPLLVTALSSPMLGEKVGVDRWVAVALGFAGALIIVRPGAETAQWGTLILFGSTTCSALYQILTRRLAAHDSPETTNTMSALYATALTTLAVPPFLTVPADLLAWSMFAALGLIGGFGHYFLARAYTLGPAAVISPFNYAQLLPAALLGWVVFGDFPDLWTWFGAAVIVASGLYVVARERQARGARP